MKAAQPWEAGPLIQNFRTRLILGSRSGRIRVRLVLLLFLILFMLLGFGGLLARHLVIALRILRESNGAQHKRETEHQTGDLLHLEIYLLSGYSELSGSTP